MPTVQHYADIVNGWIGNMQFPARPVGLYEPIAYMLGGGGKRLRPTLLCATADAFGLDCHQVRSQALAIEMFHNFTLLHDDVMDDADVRHGKPTVHVKWNVPAAILSGDTMLTLAGQLAGQCEAECREPILDLFNLTAIQIYEGQQYDMNFETRNDVTINQYLEMIRLKTAVLLSCACRMGATLAHASSPDIESISRYAENLGLAFQLRDDYLDTFGDSATFGKQIGGDILNDKKSYLSVVASQLDPDCFHDLSAGFTGDLKVKKITELYVSLGVNTKCMDEINRFTNLALESLDAISSIDVEFKDFFKKLAYSAVTREN